MGRNINYMLIQKSKYVIPTYNHRLTHCR